MGGQKRSFFVIIINVKQRRQARQKSRHPVVKRDLVVHNETDEIPACAGMTRESRDDGGEINKQTKRGKI